VSAERDRSPIEELARLLEDPAAGSGDEVHGETEETSELLVLAGSLRAIETPRPRPEFRDELRARLIREAAESSLGPAQAATPETERGWLERTRERWLEIWQSGVIATASLVGAVAIFGIGIVAAAEHAQPGDLLYGVKQVSEQVRLSLAGDQLDEGRLYLELAERRSDEVATGARELASRDLVETLDRMDDLTVQGARRFLDAYNESGDTDLARELQSFVERQRAGLTTTIPDLPGEAAPRAQDSLALLDRIEEELGSLVLHGRTDLNGGAEIGERDARPPASEIDADVRIPSRDAASAEAGAPTSGNDGTSADEEGDEARLQGIIPVAPDSSGSGSLTEAVEDTSDTVGGTVGRTTERVGDTVDEAGDELDKIVDDLDDAVNDLTKDLEDTTGNLLP
jgi:hypothetical protein